MTERELLKLVLEALIGARAFLESDAPIEIWGVNDKAITAIKETLAQPEPTYHLRQFGDVTKEELDRYLATGDISPPQGIYTTPPQRTWVGLTEEDFVLVNQLCINPIDAAEFVAHLLKEKNT